MMNLLHRFTDMLPGIDRFTDMLPGIDEGEAAKLWLFCEEDQPSL